MKGLFDGTSPGFEPVALEEAGLVEALDERADLLGGRRLAVSPAKDPLDLGHRVLSVEERHQVQQRERKDRDLIRVPGRIAERDPALTVLLHGKGFEHQASRLIGQDRDVYFW